MIDDEDDEISARLDCHSNKIDQTNTSTIICIAMRALDASVTSLGLLGHTIFEERWAYNNSNNNRREGPQDHTAGPRV